MAIARDGDSDSDNEVLTSGGRNGLEEVRTMSRMRFVKRGTKKCGMQSNQSNMSGMQRRAEVLSWTAMGRASWSLVTGGWMGRKEEKPGSATTAGRHARQEPDRHLKAKEPPLPPPGPTLWSTSSWCVPLQVRV